MRILTGAQVVAMGSAVLLIACTNDVVAPKQLPGNPRPATMVAGCGGWQPERIQSLTSPPQLAGVTITATYPGGGGLPWDIMQQMRFPLNYGAETASCLNSPVATYRAETLYVAPMDTIPVPEGVDADWWASLSPREQKALLAKAEEAIRLYPDRFARVSTAIIVLFEESVKTAKVRAKLRANDFFGTSAQTELFAGAVYGCQLYQTFITQDRWHLSNAETLTLVIDLVTAFAEAQFVYSPLRALQFGRNGAVGAAMAAASTSFGDCGRLMFDSIPGGRINVDDPYQSPRFAPTPPSYQPPVRSFPIDWNDQ